MLGLDQRNSLIGYGDIKIKFVKTSFHFHPDMMIVVDGNDCFLTSLMVEKALRMISAFIFLNFDYIDYFR